MGYKLKYTRQADKDARLLEQAGLKENAVKLLSVIKKNPYQNPPAYEKLHGDLKGSYSRRINKQHRILYDVLPNDEKLKDENGFVLQVIYTRQLFQNISRHLPNFINLTACVGNVLLVDIAGFVRPFSYLVEIICSVP